MRLVNVPSLLERLGIKAKRKGREWWACCPLHQERTPSWQIRDDEDDPTRHGRWRCLGACHTGGGPVSLVMSVLAMSSREAWEWLRTGSVVERHVLAIDFEETTPDLSRLVTGFRLPLGVEFAPLCEWPEAARAYILGRGVTEEQVDRWGIGYATGGKLAHRIVFPWRSGRGELLGYTARTILKDAKRYREPSEEEGAPRGAVYGEELWPAPKARDTLVVIEGGFNGLAVERATGLPFGAACGSQFLPAHAAKISTFRRVVVIGDPDEAGRGFREAIVGGIGRWSEVVPIDLDRGFDPARIAVERGEHALKAIIDEVVGN